VNGGTTFEPIFDRYATGSIGDVAVYQKDPKVIWVGTGEANNRNDVGGATASTSRPTAARRSRTSG